MEALIVIYVIYMIAATLLTVVGFFWLLGNYLNKVPYKEALRIFIIGIIMFVIGFGTCVVVLNGNNGI
jgi:heme O synthase-like polyprenyltransferase